MRMYQLILVLKSDLTEAEKKKLLDNVKSYLTGLKIAKENEWGIKDLNYEIKKQNKGLYVELNIEGENIPMDFEKKLLTSDNILRHLLLRKN
jgi:small subunit ribosomal protein S6